MRVPALRLAATLVVLATSPLAPHPACAQEPPSGEGSAGPAPSARMTIGGASILFEEPGGARRWQEGVALGFRASRRTSERFGHAVSFTWGLTDWDRAREWIDAGNSSGSWTTDKIKRVARWSQEGGDAQSLHFLGAIFAEAFLVMTYAAVPVCYVGSLGGATSHLQVDATGTAHLGSGELDLYAEGGVGAAGIPYRFIRWDYALGPVLGLGVEAGPIRVGGRVLWSPGGLNSSNRSDQQLFTASLTIGGRY